MFSSFELNPLLLRALAQLDYKKPTSVQQRVIPIALRGRDLLVSAKTGSGKTAAFLLPCLNKLLASESLSSSAQVLILLPTRELAEQIFQLCKQFLQFSELNCVLLIGGEDFKKQLNKLAKSPNIIIATPGRIVEHIENQSLSLADIEILVLDEADRLLEMGFEQALFKISSACNSKRQNLFFSATLKNNTIRSLSENMLNEPQIVAIDNRRESPENIHHQVILADDTKHKQNLVVGILKEEQVEEDDMEQESAPQVMVFCNTKTQCRQLGNYLLYKKIKAEFIHGDIPQNKRRQILENFRQGESQVIVATDIASRGLDIDNVDLVINFECPFSGDDYLHRSGRTGRGGIDGLAITLISANEWNLMYSIERYLRLHFEQRRIAGLVASYKGPKKLKKSGKAIGSKKNKKSKKKMRKRRSKK